MLCERASARLGVLWRFHRPIAIKRHFRQPILAVALANKMQGFSMGLALCAGERAVTTGSVGFVPGRVLCSERRRAEDISSQPRSLLLPWTVLRCWYYIRYWLRGHQICERVAGCLEGRTLISARGVRTIDHEVLGKLGRLI